MQSSLDKMAYICADTFDMKGHLAAQLACKQCISIPHTSVVRPPDAVQRPLASQYMCLESMFVNLPGAFRNVSKTGHGGPDCQWRLIAFSNIQNGHLDCKGKLHGPASTLNGIYLRPAALPHAGNSPGLESMSVFPFSMYSQSQSVQTS